MPPSTGAQGGAPGAGDANGGQQQQQQRGGGLLQGIIRAVVMWYVMKQFTGGGRQSGTPGGKDGSVVQLRPTLGPESPMDVHVYVSEKSDWKQAAHSEEPVWMESSVLLASGKPRHYAYTYRPSDTVQSNGSVYVHAIFTPPGASSDPWADDFDGALSFGKTNSLNLYLPKQKEEEGVNLLGRSTGDENLNSPPRFEEVKGTSNETVILNYLKPNITISMINEYKNYPSNQIPPQYKKVIQINQESQRYYPHVWFNDFWMLRDYLVPVNETLDEITLHFSIETLNALKFIFFVQMEQSFSMQEQWGMSSSSEADEVKRIFLEGNPYFLGLTVFVSLLHSVFDVLAFKNDVAFWKENKSMKGLSARTVLINAGCQLIIFLYLMDSPETSTVVLISTGVGTAIEFWKVTKAMDVSIQRSRTGIPYLRFKDRASYTQSETDKHDAEAMRYLSYALYPLVAGYAIYALIYRTHKSWYSWILHSLVGAVYTFGFILMCPQLYLNYKLKSVAHLPWRQMTYKFLNTIIDDLFAFVIKMPLLHRLSVFRDDLIFLVYLYQRWIYRVDKTRANEFGYVEAPSKEEQEAETKGRTKASTTSDDAGRSETSSKITEEETKKDK